MSACTGECPRLHDPDGVGYDKARQIQAEWIKGHADEVKKWKAKISEPSKPRSRSPVNRGKGKGGSGKGKGKGGSKGKENK